MMTPPPQAQAQTPTTGWQPQFVRDAQGTITIPIKNQAGNTVDHPLDEASLPLIADAIDQLRDEHEALLEQLRTDAEKLNHRLMERDTQLQALADKVKKHEATIAELQSHIAVRDISAQAQVKVQPTTPAGYVGIPKRIGEIGILALVLALIAVLILWQTRSIVAAFIGSAMVAALAGFAFVAVVVGIRQYKLLTAAQPATDIPPTPTRAPLVGTQAPATPAQPTPPAGPPPPGTP